MTVAPLIIKDKVAWSARAENTAFVASSRPYDAQTGKERGGSTIPGTGEPGTRPGGRGWKTGRSQSDHRFVRSGFEPYVLGSRQRRPDGTRAARLEKTVHDSVVALNADTGKSSGTSKFTRTTRTDTTAGRKVPSCRHNVEGSARKVLMIVGQSQRVPSIESTAATGSLWRDIRSSHSIGHSGLGREGPPNSNARSQRAQATFPGFIRGRHETGLAS